MSHPLTTPHQPVSNCRRCGSPHPPSSATRLRTCISDITKSAHDGCQTCALFMQGLRKCLGDDTMLWAGSLRIDSNLTGVRGLDVTAHGADGHCFPSVSFFSHGGQVGESAGDDSPTTSWPVGYIVPSSTISNESFTWAETQLLACNAHPLCKTNQSTPLPNRILYIGSSTPPDTIQLQSSQGRCDRYICLSHCWGTMPFLCTTKENLYQHREVIPMRDLPKTFQDAIDFSRRLGVHFLWIDSLCIVQDDENDWRREGARMADVYANAYLTIAATSGSGPHTGLFADLGPEFDAHPLVPTGLTELTEPCPQVEHPSPTPKLFARREFAHTDYLGVGSIGHTTIPDPELPLLYRGWVLQERLLSQRVLYFNRHEISWECATQSSCQCRGAWDGTSRTEALTRTLQNETNVSSVVERWLRLVQQYSSLGLTFERDIFPALSGLAKVFQGSIGTRYVAGIWEGHALPGLLWHISMDAGGRERGLSGRAEKWRAPTWSWASAVEKIIFLAVGELNNACEVVSMQSRPAGPDPTGEIEHGEIILRGQVLTSKLRYRERGEDARYWNTFGLELTDGIPGEVCVDYDLAAEGSGHVAPGTDLPCLHVGTGKSGTCEFLMLRQVWGLDGTELGVYERIGMARVFGRPFGPPIFNLVVKGKGIEKTVKII